MKNSCRIGGDDLSVALKDVNKDPEFYFTSEIAGVGSVFISLEVTFVNKNDSEEVYSFPFGPYFVYKGSNSTDETHTCPPEDDLGVNGYDTAYFHMLRLSSLVRISLEKQLKDNELDLGEAQKYVDANFNGNGLDLGDLSKWDIYISYGSTSSLDPAFLNSCFRNVFKCNDSEFWKKFWE